MLRPSCSTSGGQSAGRVSELVVAVAGVEDELGVGAIFLFPVMVAQSAADMQVRQLLFPFGQHIYTEYRFRRLRGAGEEGIERTVCHLSLERHPQGLFFYHPIHLSCFPRRMQLS